MLLSERRSLFASALLIVFGLTRPLGARPVEADAAAGDVRSSAVEIVVVGREEDVLALASALGPNEFRGATARFERGERLNLKALLDASASDAEVRCYVDLSTPGHADLYFADRHAERFLVRHVALPEGLDDLGRETLGQVLTLSVLALLDDDASTLSRDEARALLDEQGSPPAPPADVTENEAVEPTSALASAPRASVGLEPFYAMRAFAGEAVFSHGPGLDIGWITGAERVTNALWLGATYELEKRLRAEPASVTWSTLTLRGAFEHVEPIGSISVGARAGAGVDWLSFTPASGTNDGVELRSAGVTTSFLLHVGLGARLSLGTRLLASLRVFADVYPTRARYAVERSDGDRLDVLEPFRVRPGAALGVLLR